MRTKIRYGLKYEDGWYLSTNPDRFPLSNIEWDARRFYSNEDIAEFMRESPYRPELWGLDPERFEVVQFEMTIREVTVNANTQSGTEESEVTTRD